MLRWLALLLFAGAAFAADPPSRIPPYMIYTDPSTSYTAIVFSSTNNLKQALRWIDTNWPTNIDINVTYAPLANLEEYLVRTNLLNAGVEDGLVAKTYVETNFVAGTNISGATYDSAGKTWAVASQPGRLLDWMLLTDGKFREVNASSTTTNMLDSWRTEATSGEGLLSYDSGYVRVPSNSIAVLYATGSCVLDGTNYASNIVNFYGTTEGSSTAVGIGAVGGQYRHVTPGLEDRLHQGIVIAGSAVVVTPSTKYVDVSVQWTRSQTGIAGAGRGTTLTMNTWRVMLYSAGL